MLTENFWVEAEMYLKEGFKVLDLHNGGRVDFTKNLSEIVGKSGIIYSLNLSRMSNKNYFDGKDFSNVQDIKFSFPNNIKGVKNLDAILMKDFYFKKDLKVDPFSVFPRILKKWGKVLVARTHSCKSQYAKDYMLDLELGLKDFQRVFNSSDLFVYNKLK